VASNATISNRGVLVLSGGTAIGTVVNSNTGLQWTGSGAMVVSSGGVASGTVVNSGGLINVRSSGTEIGGIVSAGGFIGVGTNNLSGTTIGDTLIGSGNVFAVERVSRGAVASSTVVSSAGLLIISSAGLTTGAQILAGGSAI